MLTPRESSASLGVGRATSPTSSRLLMILNDALRVRIDWGLRLGMTVAGVYFCLATLILLLRDSETSGGLLGRIAKAAVGYVVAGCVGGAGLGALLPLCKTHIGALAVSCLAALLALVGLVVTWKGWGASWSAVELESVILGAAIFGTLFARAVRHRL